MNISLLIDLNNLENIYVGNDSLCNKKEIFNGYFLYLINIPNLHPIQYNHETSFLRCSSIFYSSYYFLSFSNYRC